MIKIANPSNKSSGLYAFAIGLLLQVKQECLLAGETEPKDPNGLYAKLKELYDAKYRGIAEIEGHRFIDFVLAFDLYHPEKSEAFIRKLLKTLEEKDAYLRGLENREKIKNNSQMAESDGATSSDKKIKEKLPGDELKAKLERLAKYFERRLSFEPGQIHSNATQKTIQVKTETKWFSKQIKWFTIINPYACDEKIVPKKRDVYKKYILSPELSLKEIQDVFLSYLRGNHSFFCLNSRHHLNEAKELLARKGSVEEALAKMQEMMQTVKNKNGSFAKRVDYLFYRHYGKTCKEHTESLLSTQSIPSSSPQQGR